MPTPPAARRSRRAEEARAARREEILAAARQVFRRNGFGGTTIADIADEAGIALGTIYLYFASKGEVFAALNALFNELIARAVSNVPPTESLDEAVRTRVDNVFRACSENRDLVRLSVINTDGDSPVGKRLHKAEQERQMPLVQALARAMDTGMIRRGDPYITTKLAQGLVSMAVYQAFVLSDGTDAEAYRKMCSDMLLAYMAPAAQDPPAGATTASAVSSAE
jgi:AcrR family transcriptional regulator